ncbi:MAG: hypothetical protein Q9207_004145 [Kuettlingeria erythrocarpa]
MDKAVIQALNGLVPELNGPLPPELLELAMSLLAQSRNKASSLKPEEEIARTYACAHIACERLKQNLGLPKIQPRPPCPPRVYQKLYRHLDSALAISARRIARASKPAEPATPNRTLKATPRKPATTPTRTPASARNKRKREATIFDNIPSWVMAAIRVLCRRLDAPSAPPHIFSGVSSILTVPTPALESLGPNGMDRLRSLSVEALVIAVYVLARNRLLGVETDSERYPVQRDEALMVMSELRSDDEPSVHLDSTSVDSWMREISNNRWTDMDWFENIGEGAGLAIDPIRTESDDGLGRSDFDEDEDLVIGRNESNRYKAERPFLQPGLGTMMQDRVDYLSEEKRADYRQWKKNILARIERLEQTQRLQKPEG